MIDRITERVRHLNRDLSRPISRRGLIITAAALVAAYNANRLISAASSVAETGLGVAAQAGRTVSRIRINIADPEDPNAAAMRNRPGVLTQVAKATEDAKTPIEAPRTPTVIAKPSPKPEPIPNKAAIADSLKSAEKLPVIASLPASEAKRLKVDMQRASFHIKPEQWPVISTAAELLRCINETDLLPQYFQSRGINMNSIKLSNIHAKRAYSELPAFIATLGMGISKEKAEQILSKSNKSVEMTFRLNNKLTSSPATMLDNKDEVKRRREELNERNIFWTGENFWTITIGNQVILIHENCINPLVTNLVGENTPTVTPTATVPDKVPPTQPDTSIPSSSPTQPAPSASPTQPATASPTKAASASPTAPATATRESSATPQDNPEPSATPVPPTVVPPTVVPPTVTREPSNTPQDNPEPSATIIPTIEPTVPPASPTTPATIIPTRESTNTPQTNPETPAATNTPGSAPAAASTPVPAASNTPGRASTSTPGREPTRAAR
ncbi:MAG: hypothetical protein Q7S88_01895 [Candidatus Daviesbacteria bacterium]|nr:hypothetical protein [Candidatus Daviesbacteria bacterium]